MNLLILGASGATGRELVRQAVEQGHAVTAFVRNPAKLDAYSKVSNVRVAQGDVADLVAVERAIAGCDAVLSALGAATPLRRYSDLVTGVRNVVGAMERAGVRRLVYQSWLGVTDSRAQLGFLGKYVVAPIVLRHPTADHEENEDVIRASALDWTIVRPPKLTNGRRTGAYRSGERIAAASVMPTISRADVAEFMLRQLSERTYVRKAVAVLR